MGALRRGRVAAHAALHYVCLRRYPHKAEMQTINPAEDGLPKPQRYWAILTLMVGLAMSCLDTAIVNVALPVIAKDLHTSAADSIWVVNAYQLAVMISLLPFASFGDIFGYRRVYRFGLVLYTAAALVSALATSLDMLTLGRALQGLGAAGVMSVNTALVRFTYPRRQLGRGIALVSFVVAVSSAAGPSVAAAILAVAAWPWLFAINVPIGIVTLLLSFRYLPHTPPAFSAASASRCWRAVLCYWRCCRRTRRRPTSSGGLHCAARASACSSRPTIAPSSRARPGIAAAAPARSRAPRACWASRSARPSSRSSSASRAAVMARRPRS